jgi:transposase InsO family protein
MCQLMQVSHAGYYRSLQEHCPVEEEMQVRSAIQQVVVDHRRRYGYRRVVVELEKLGLVVNHKRVLRLMREDNLLALQPKRFVVTTYSQHSLEIAVNLARRMKLTGVNQLWVADITYIQVWREFVFLAMVLDDYSRKVVGWELSRSLGSGLAVKALEKAIAERQPAPGLVHHSDRGVQYASREYVALLEQHQMIASMSRPGNPYDNARCERFIRTLKQEEIYASAYRDLEHLRNNLEEFIERYYNQKRLHSALGYRTPEEFERAQSGDPTLKAATVTCSFGKTNTGLLGTGTQTPSPSPNPNPCCVRSRKTKGVHLSSSAFLTGSQQDGKRRSGISTRGMGLRSDCGHRRMSPNALEFQIKRSLCAVQGRYIENMGSHRKQLTCGLLQGSAPQERRSGTQKAPCPVLPMTLPAPIGSAARIFANTTSGFLRLSWIQ